ncbi:uroporphyrinogen-III C-methyltransferase [soil metagenome]
MGAVGGGRVDARRLAGLVDAGAEITLIAPRVSTSIQAMAEAGRLRWATRGYADGDLLGAWYALALTDEPRVNAAVVAEADRRGIFCARADEATAASAWTPATGRHDDVTVAVFGGQDPRRAAGVRDEILRRLQDGSLPATRRRLEPGVVLVGAGPGDPGLLTVRGAAALRDAEVVIADNLVPRSVLDELSPDVEIVDAAKLPYGRAMAQERINELLVARARAGKYVVRLKGGDPMLFGRGFEEVLACAAAGVRVEVVPGLTSAVAVPAAAGVPVTHRGVAHEVVVLSGHLAPEDPGSMIDWAARGRLRGTLILMMAVQRMGPIAAALIRHGRDAGTPVVVICDGTTPAQRSLRATLGTVAAAIEEAGFRPPAIVVVGDVAGLSAAAGVPRPAGPGPARTTPTSPAAPG